jgi:hypothetical protein
MSDEVGVAPRPIDVEADVQVSTHMVTKSHTERSNAVCPTGRSRAFRYVPSNPNARRFSGTIQPPLKSGVGGSLARSNIPDTRQYLRESRRSPTSDRLSSRPVPEASA